MALDDFLGKGVGLPEDVGLFETFLSEPENVDPRLAAADEFTISNYSLIPQLTPHVNVDSGQ